MLVGVTAESVNDSCYEAGFTPYREQRWDEALELYGKCLRLRPNDGPSKLME